MKWSLALIIILGASVLYGCNLPITPAPLVTPCPGCVFLPACTISDLGVAGNLDPGGYALVSTNPTLEWDYPQTGPSAYPYPAGSTDCDPRGYEVSLWPYSSIYPDFGGSVSGASSTSFNPDTLEPATLYHWRVRAMSNLGPGEWSQTRAFWTGPLCSTGVLIEPRAIRPRGTVNTLRPLFTWYGGGPYDRSCMPNSYHFELSTDASFSTIIASVDSGLAQTQRWTPEADLEDCTAYYWRVAARNGSASGSGQGPYVNASFRTEVGLCTETFVFIPSIDANCRIGPNPLYNRFTILTSGDRLPVSGRHENEDETWFKLNLPDNAVCWVSEVTGDFEGDPSLLPIDTDFPPLPVDKPDDGPSCKQITSSSICNSTPGCSYNFNAKQCE